MSNVKVFTMQDIQPNMIDYVGLYITHMGQKLLEHILDLYILKQTTNKGLF